MVLGGLRSARLFRIRGRCTFAMCMTTVLYPHQAREVASPLAFHDPPYRVPNSCVNPHDMPGSQY
jgi:hypothetical protein